ncbi:uncharacterized protein LOC135371581 [Ornithodoros turicata]|uniref:uncharacterized protein LOC135371581 n=1 Tax=Ornithodoros turicata TaxID=34597 RepID=UPI0031391F38
MERLKVKRTSRRRQATRLVGEAKTALSSTPNDRKTVESLLERLRVNLEELKEINSEFEGHLKDDELEVEYEMALEYEENSIKEMSNLRVALQELTSVSTPATQVAAPTNVALLGTQSAAHTPSLHGNHAGTRLPKLQLMRFRGDLSEWLPFWEQFKGTVHNNSNLSQPEKFFYLRSLLDGAAAAAISGLQASEVCYNDAIEILMERFGDKRRIERQYLTKLRTLPPIKTHKDFRGLRKLYDQVQANVRGLKALGVESSSFATMLTDTILSALPTEMAMEYYRTEKRGQQLGTASLEGNGDETNAGVSTAGREIVGTTELDRILKFLLIEIESFEHLKFNGCAYDDNEMRGHQRQGDRQNSNNGGFKTRPAASVLHTTAREMTNDCIFCNTSRHITELCDADIPLAEKKTTLAAQKRCFRCTKHGHHARMCRKKITCSACGGRHVRTMCDPLWKPSEQTKVKEVVSTSMHTSGTGEDVKTGTVVLLQTFRAWAVAEGRSLYLRGVIDGGSQRTFVRQDIARELNLPSAGEIDVTINTFGNRTSRREKQRRRLVKLCLRSQYGGEVHVFEAIEVPFICEDLVTCPLDNEDVRTFLLSEEKLADECRFSGVRTEDGIGVLLGSDQMWKIMTRQVRQSNAQNNLVAINTALGWTFQGPVSVRSSLENKDSTLVCVLRTDATHEASLQMFWEIEHLGITDGNSNDEGDDKVLCQFKETVQKVGGRYAVTLPWKNDFVLNDNLEVAESRLNGLLKKLKKNGLMAEYDAAMRKYASDGHAEKVLVESENGKQPQQVYYMPHQAVVKQESETTKLRVVFDGSSHAPTVASLNDCLEKGPSLNTDLLPVLIRFRMYRIGLAADIEKAFLQVEVQERDRDALRFLWCQDGPTEDISQNPVEVWRMKRVPFGTTASPFLLAATLRHHLDNVKGHFQRTARHIVNSFYVDDLLTGSSTVDGAITIYNDASSILQEAGMNLRKWISNAEEVRKQFGEQDTNSRQERTLSCREDRKVLGILWDTYGDTLKVSGKRMLEDGVALISSKRGILSAAAKLFDPLGMLSPFSIRIKMLFQRLWEEKLDWDTPLTGNIQELWHTWWSELPKLDNIALNRCLVPDGNYNFKYELHIFSDASPYAYGACLYLRAIANGRTAKVGFVFAKARVAPLKALTLPRLELMGALLGVRLSKKITETLTRLKEVTCVYWTDSSITLCWVRGSPLRWKQFVRNRVIEIQEKSDVSAWRFCPGKENPADLLTRGESLETLEKCDTWWNGPKWLERDEDEWPAQTVLPEIKDLTDQEDVHNDATTLQSSVNMGVPAVLDLDRFSSLRRALRVTAWIKRFVDNSRPGNPRVFGALSTEDISWAENYWMKRAQEEWYGLEKQTLSLGKALEKNSAVVKLAPFLDNEGIMRISGRLHFLEISGTVKHPILLPPDHRFTVLTVESVHLRVLHGGVQDTLTELRERFWIPKGRQIVKKVIFHCRGCTRYRAKAATARMAPLPQDRVEAGTPFEVIGIDLAGPVFFKGAVRDEKSYILLITCATTRAIHLELVSKMSTECFLLAFSRFIARRGIPKVIYTDNALTFKKASKDISIFCDTLQRQRFHDYCTEKMITWKFIMTYAPWWGGFWERLVKTVKGTLRKTLGRNRYGFEELTTILQQVEAVVNSRPLTYLGDCPEDLSPLTPAHFLTGKRLTCLPMAPIPTPRSTSAQVKANWIKDERAIDSFWKRWLKEYLLQLRSAHSWSVHKSLPVKEGDVVLISEEKVPRHMWKMGRVATVFWGRDKVVRACAVKLPDKTVLRRPVQLLYPLEMV